MRIVLAVRQSADNSLVDLSLMVPKIASSKSWDASILYRLFGTHAMWKSTSLSADGTPEDAQRSIFDRKCASHNHEMNEITRGLWFLHLDRDIHNQVALRYRQRRSRE